METKNSWELRDICSQMAGEEQEIHVAMLDWPNYY
jgi:hypothetical protein